MKNTLLILISILLLMAGVLEIISAHSDYASERLFYQAIRINSDISTNPDVAPPRMLVVIEQKLRKIMTEYPDSKLSRQAGLVLGQFYLNIKKYEQATALADEIVRKYGDDRTLVSKAYFLKGVSFEEQRIWDKALEQYQLLRDNYADTLLGLGIPLYIAEHYKEEGKLEAAKAAYEEAVSFYRRQEIKNRQTGNGYAAANLLMRVYMELGQYEQAGRTLENVVNYYSKARTLVQQLPNIEAIFINKLNNPDKALQLYAIIKDRINNKQVSDFIDGRIKALNVQKNGQ